MAKTNVPRGGNHPGESKANKLPAKPVEWENRRGRLRSQEVEGNSLKSQVMIIHPPSRLLLETIESAN